MQNGEFDAGRDGDDRGGEREQRGEASGRPWMWPARHLRTHGGPIVVRLMLCHAVTPWPSG